MSRAIQRLMKDYHKAEKLVGRSSNESITDLANSASLTSQTYAQQMAQLRRDPELTQDEKKYLVAVERGDMATTRRYLDMSTSAPSASVSADTPITPININCLDPLGRSALLIAIEYENIEMIELLLNYNVDTGEALLHAIDEEFVEAVELLLHHEDLRQQQPKPMTNNTAEEKSKCPNNIAINDKSNQLFSFAQVALERDKKNEEQTPQGTPDVSQKSKSAWSFFHTSKSNLSAKHTVSGNEKIITATVNVADTSDQEVCSH